ncbi:ferric-dicitrate binding protein FerR (iron transport regulator) [Chryseobacterium ginsenosidimutans]|uniref:FecR family protein n=1 Tax=Chryseobacterium ginsenosidimutans TaxID=687846 RepID=UPI00216772BC|nr:FecR family protein [Chryseobacterium ginsenosidimutans]MCS3870270.1 ferric-dicitrate binding protein FerR (iron transport regulator) [Chryseobacterium ginsenosidimutans]
MDFEKNWKSISEENQKIDGETDQRIWNGIQNKISKKRQKLYWAAAVLIPIFGLLFFYNSENKLEQKQNLVFETKNKSQVFTLPDGSHIKLFPNSKLSLQENFGKKERGVNFEGYGYFDIAKDKSRAFKINAKAFHVQVLGTKFYLDQKSPEKKVELLEGKVKIENQGKITFLMPKESWVTDVNNIEHHYYSPDLVRTFTFKNNNFSDVINTLKENYNIDLEYPSEYKNEKISGSFKGNLNEILIIISYPFNFKIDHSQKNTIILK